SLTSASSPTCSSVWDGMTKSRSSGCSGGSERAVTHLKTGWATGPVPLQGGQPSDSCLAFACLHETALVCQHDRLHTVAEAQLGEHPAEMGLHGRLAQPQLPGDLGV